MQSKYSKISTIGGNVKELLCATLCTDYSSDLFKKFQLAFIYDTNIEYQFRVSVMVVSELC